MLYICIIINNIMRKKKEVIPSIEEGNYYIIANSCRDSGVYNTLIRVDFLKGEYIIFSTIRNLHGNSNSETINVETRENFNESRIVKEDLGKDVYLNKHDVSVSIDIDK